LRRLLFFCLLSWGLWGAEDPCSEAFQNDPFPIQIVNQVLEQYNVPAQDWTAINLSLRRQLALVDVKVQQKAAQLERNPFNPPRQAVVIGRLKREALIESFGYVMRQHGIKEKRDIYDMFDAIQDEKAERVWECLRGS